MTNEDVTPPLCEDVTPLLARASPLTPPLPTRWTREGRSCPVITFSNSPKSGAAFGLSSISDPLLDIGSYPPR